MNAQLDFSFSGPLARSTDPETSHMAGEAVRPAQDLLKQTIRAYVRQYPMSSAFQIAEGILAMPAFKDRWDEGTIRAACSRADLDEHLKQGRSPRGQKCTVYSVRFNIENTNAL
jgi:hypothetical protein